MRDRRDIPMLILLYLCGFNGAFNNNLVNVAIPGFIAEFGIDSAAAQWTISGYMIVTLLGVTSMAFLYRRFKMRNLFYVAMGVNILGCLICFLAPNFAVLMIGRLIMGIGTGITSPLMMNSVLILSRPERRGTMLAIGSTIITLAPAFAPAISGAMVTGFGWRAVFVPTGSLSILLSIAGAFLMRNINEAKDASFDPLSAVLLVLGLTPFAFGLTRIVSAPLVAIVALVVGAAILAVFGRRQLKSSDPLLNVRPLGKAAFWPAVVMVFAALMANFSICMVAPLYFQDAMGLTAFVSGLFVLIPVIFNSLTALFAGPLMDRHGAWPLIPISFLMMLVGQIGVALGMHAATIAVVVVVACVISAGVGFASAPSQTAGLSHLAPQDSPHGVALMTAAIQLAGCMAPALYVGTKGAVQAITASPLAGCTVALWVAAGVTFVCTVISFVYCWAFRKR